MSHHQSASPPRGRTRPPPPVPSPRAGRSHHRRGPQAGYLVLNDDSTSHLARMFAPDSRGHSCKPSARAPRFCGSFGPGRAARMRSWATLHRRRARSGGRRPPLQPPAPPRPSSPAPSTAVRLTPPFRVQPAPGRHPPQGSGSHAGPRRQRAALTLANAPPPGVAPGRAQRRGADAVRPGTQSRSPAPTSGPRARPSRARVAALGGGRPRRLGGSALDPPYRVRSPSVLTAVRAGPCN